MTQKIIVAEGLDLRDFQGVALLNYLNTVADVKPGSLWTYPKGAKAKPTYEVEVVYTQAEFAKALDTPDAYVIYEGHSRYGQGPAFGPPGPPRPPEPPWVPDSKNFPINPWGVHFRMGYDAISTKCIEDLVGHSVKPAEYDLTQVPDKAFLRRDLKRAGEKAKRVEQKVKKGKMRRSKLCPVPNAWRSFDSCDRTLAGTTTPRGDQPLRGRHFYSRQPRKGPDEFLTAVTVGSADLGQVSLKCKVFFMHSCTSYRYYYLPLIRRRKAVKSKCKIYLTHKVPRAYYARDFISLVFQGYDPTRDRDAVKICKILNGVDFPGKVKMY